MGLWTLNSDSIDPSPLHPKTHPLCCFVSSRERKNGVGDALQGLGIRAQGAGFRAEGLGLRVRIPQLEASEAQQVRKMREPEGSKDPNKRVLFGPNTMNVIVFGP